jgi:hypothetical protein
VTRSTTRDARVDLSVITYPSATFGWDSRFSSATYDAGVNKGRGGINTIVADQEIARQSREAVVEFFATALLGPRRSPTASSARSHRVGRSRGNACFRHPLTRT